MLPFNKKGLIGKNEVRSPARSALLRYRARCVMTKPAPTTQGGVDEEDVRMWVPDNEHFEGSDEDLEKRFTARVEAFAWVAGSWRSVNVGWARCPVCAFGVRRVTWSPDLCAALRSGVREE